MARLFTTYFNPRSPCGERPGRHGSTVAVIPFQSTLPVWGATSAVADLGKILEISIHAPRVGSDGGKAANRFDLQDFNPRSPGGERQP